MFEHYLDSSCICHCSKDLPGAGAHFHGMTFLWVSLMVPHILSTCTCQHTVYSLWHKPQAFISLGPIINPAGLLGINIPPFSSVRKTPVKGIRIVSKQIENLLSSSLSQLPGTSAFQQGKGLLLQGNISGSDIVKNNLTHSSLNYSQLFYFVQSVFSIKGP